MSSFGSALCDVNSPNAFLDAHFPEKGPLGNEPGEKMHRSEARAHLGLQETRIRCMKMAPRRSESAILRMRARIRCIEIAPRSSESALLLKHARADAHVRGGVRMARRTRIWRLKACTGASCIRARAHPMHKKCTMQRRERTFA